MTQEEKAKRYDEALKKMKSWVRGEHPECFTEAQKTAEFIFPELKESEDDRIRKAIMEFFELQDDNTTYSFIPKKDILAWLEKQGKHLENYDEAEKEKTEFVGDGFIKCHADFLDFKEGNTYWLEYIGDDKYNVRSDNLLGQTYHITPGQLYTVFKKLTWIGNWIGKRGGNLQFWRPTKEQFEALDYAYNSCPDTERGNYYEGVLETLIDDLHRLEKQGEKPQGKSALEAAKEEKIDNDQNWVIPTNNPEPKFREGDWVVTDKGVTIQIATVNPGYYILYDGMEFSKSYVDKYWHLWTIQDAKAGDVLIGKIDGDEYILIFKEIKDGWIETYGHYYDAVDRFFVPSQLFCRDYKGTFCPATKEQRDLLFSKMKEARYEWDDEKKKLKKIDDEEVNGEDYGIDGLWHAKRILEKTLGSVSGYQTDDGILDHKAAITAVKKLYEQKPTWTEEDGKKLSDILAILRCGENCYYNSHILIDWLKSLKERIGG